MSNDQEIRYVSHLGARRTLTPFRGASLPKAVRQAQDAAVEAISAVRPARRAADAAAGVPQRLKNEDELAARRGEDFDAKKAAKKRAEAEEAAEAARLGAISVTAKADRAYSALIETATHHTPAWRAAALDEIDAAMLRVTTVREQTRAAGAALIEAMQIVQMLAELPTTNSLQVHGVKTAVGFPEIEISSALEHLANIIGSAASFLDDVRESDKAAKAAPSVAGSSESDDDEGDDLDDENDPEED